MRAGQGDDATFHLGEKYPIQNASYAPIYNSPQISAVLGNQTYVPPFPSVSYEDLGLNVKAKPTVHGNGSVSLQLELQVRSLTGRPTTGSGHFEPGVQGQHQPEGWRARGRGRGSLEDRHARDDWHSRAWVLAWTESGHGE